MPLERAAGRCNPSKEKCWRPGPACAWSCWRGGTRVMEPHLFRVAPEAGSGESYTHEGEEFLYVLRGELAITLEKKEYRLKTGDSFYFESATPHHWKNPGRSGNLGAVGEYAADVLSSAEGVQRVRRHDEGATKSELCCFAADA